jgi:glutamate-ammonia-ligase adenylyltransferase
VQNRDSLGRVRRILADAPRLVADFKRSLTLTELLLSGEIEEIGSGVERIENLPLDAPLPAVAEAYFTVVSILLAQWSLSPGFNLGERISAVCDAMIGNCLRRLYTRFDVVVTGSLGAYNMGPGSDADLILLVDDKDRHLESEQQAQHFLSLVSHLRRLGAPLEIDLRLRPEGKKGLLVRTYEGFQAYELEGMEMWERFALGNARLLLGNGRALGVVQHAAYGLPLNQTRLRDLLKIKRRVETERVKPQHVRRDVKLGYGGLNDIEWFVHLHEMRQPEATSAGKTTEMGARIRALQRVGIVNAVEAEMLVEARRHLLALQARIYLQGLPENLLPENPDKLNRLAATLGLGGANEMLARHLEVTEAVRRLYLEGLERLKG